MKKGSILQEEKRCYVTGTMSNLHKHHIFYGIGLRKLSERHGFWVWLEGKHHNQSNLGVHCGNRQLDLRLKRDCQGKYEENNSRQEFMGIIGRNYV